MTPLRHKMIESMRRRGFSVRTQQSYLRAVADLARYHGRSPQLLEPDEVDAYFRHLVLERALAPASCRLHLNAVRYLYLKVLERERFDVEVAIPKVAQRVPELLTREEVARILVSCSNAKHGMALTTTYGCGLRVSEVVRLRVGDIDGERELAHVVLGKGGKDRMVMLSPALLAGLREYWREFHPTCWLFPGRHPRVPLGISSLQKAFTKAKVRAGVEKVGGLHSLRHAYATHQLEQGLPVHMLQRLLGHGSVTTTMRYVHWLPSYREGSAPRRPGGGAGGGAMSAAVDLQTVFDRFVPAHRSRHGLSAREGQVCAHIRDCRTGALGALEQACGECGYRREYPASCRDRHCPKCQGRASARWSERESANLLPVMYYHVVFTVPSVLNGWVSLHPQAVYGQLFESAWSTLSDFAQARLGGRLGMTAVLHTWGEQLTRHVHLHCLVPGGALDEDAQWHPVKGQYLFPVRALSRRFRGHFVAGLRRRAEAGALTQLSHHAEVDVMLDTLMDRDWVVYAKPCLGHTDSVLAYLARYTHRIAISDRRLLAMDGERVAIRCRDHRRGGAPRAVWMDGVELVRRYLLHVLPKGFMRIRHYGLLANRGRREHLLTARAAIARRTSTVPARMTRIAPSTPTTAMLCPRCRQAPLRSIGRRPARRRDTG